MGAEDLDKTNPLLDKRLMNAFVDGVIKTLDTIASTKATPEAPRIEKEYKGKGQVAGMIGMVAGSMKGMMSITFEEKAIFLVLTNMLGEEYTEVNDEVCDAVGELTNMIYGAAKTTLNEMGYGFEMAIPQVISGDNFKIGSVHSGTTLVIPFSCDAGKFFVEITVQT